MADNPQAPRLQIELDPKIASGKYANLALISHSETEIVLDFIFREPRTPKAKVHTRVILSPMNAKRVLAALRDNLGKYEAKAGKIAG